MLINATDAIFYIQYKKCIKQKSKLAKAPERILQGTTIPKHFTLTSQAFYINL